MSGLVATAVVSLGAGMSPVLDYRSDVGRRHGIGWWVLRVLSGLYGAAHVTIGLAAPLFLYLLAAKLLTGSTGNPLNISGHPRSEPEGLIIARLLTGSVLLSICLAYGIALLIACVRWRRRAMRWARAVAVISTVVAGAYCAWLVMQEPPSHRGAALLPAASITCAYALCNGLVFFALSTPQDRGSLPESLGGGEAGAA